MGKEETKGLLGSSVSALSLAWLLQSCLSWDSWIQWGPEVPKAQQMDEAFLRQASKDGGSPGKVGGFQEARLGLMVPPQMFNRWLLGTIMVSEPGSWHQVNPGLLSGYTL